MRGAKDRVAFCTVNKLNDSLCGCVVYVVLSAERKSTKRKLASRQMEFDHGA